MPVQWNDRQRVRGFTLIEMMMVVVVFGLLLSFAIPSFQSMTARNRLATQTNDFLLAVNLARSEASRIGGTVSIQGAAPIAGDEFGGGYCVVLGDPGDCNDPVIRRFPALSGAATLAGKDDTGGGDDWATPRDSIQFNSIGALDGTANQVRNVDLCLAGYLGRRIQVALIGRPKAWREAEAGQPALAVAPDC